MPQAFRRCSFVRSDLFFAVWPSPRFCHVQAVQKLHLPASQFGLLDGSIRLRRPLTWHAFVLPRLRARFPPDALFGAATAALGMMLFAMLLANHLPVLLPFVFIGGSAWIAGISCLSVASQMAMPPWARGRMNAVYLTVTQGSTALGGMAWGQATSWLGLSGALGLAAGLLLCTQVLARWHPLRLPFSLDLSPAGIAQLHSFPREPIESEGPVIVMVEYRVEEANNEAFLLAMEPVRLQRMRDGAVRWTTSQDLADPRRYIEEFTVESWGEH